MEHAIVIDACVALKWIFRDEDHVDMAENLLSESLRGSFALFAPILWIYEITNALRSAVVQSRMTERQSELDLDQMLLHSGVHLITQHRDRFSVILRDAVASHSSIYDFSYVDLARQLECDFFTGDRRLYESNRKIYPFVRWIGDFKAAN
ncbi:MAG: type II toxin-antitoxin system VapC family toxin [Candidatus Coatesbacteria bacterium]|nr:type II toxin-antitoxin system VapC family toxin [Candidatus Coatesbacteria bacterium]